MAEQQQIGTVVRCRPASVALMWLLIAAPCVAQNAPSEAAAIPPNSAPYVIGPEDVLDIAVWNNETLSRTVPVRPDGRISLPLLNDVQAAGLTPLQLRDSLAKSLAPFMSAATEVSVIVREVHSVKIAVIGEVKAPGRYELRSLTTVLDVLAMAGGLTEYAARDRIVILRREGGVTKQIPFDYTRLTSRNAPTRGGQDNLLVQPGDIIFVP